MEYFHELSTELFELHVHIQFFKFFNVFLRFPMFSNIFQCYLLSLSQSLTLSISQSLTLDMLNNFCFHVYAQKSLSHFHTLSLSHSLTLSHSHSLTLDMLKNFYLNVYAQKSLFIAEKCNAFQLGTSSMICPVTGEGVEVKKTLSFYLLNSNI